MRVARKKKRMCLKEKLIAEVLKVIMAFDNQQQKWRTLDVKKLIRAYSLIYGVAGKLK